MVHKAKNPIQTIGKTLEIIEALRVLDGAGITELAQHLDLNKGTIHHHLSTLEQHEYVVKDGTRYRLGMRFFEFGEYVRQSHKIYQIGKKEIDALANKTGELANLMVEEHGYGSYVYISKGKEAVTLDTKIGTQQYLHTSALGKSILAHMEPERLEDIITTHGLPAETPNTVTDREILFEELDEIQERGIAFDGEERAEGIRCVAAPVIDKNGSLIGAVSVSGPSTRIKGDILHEKIPEMVQDTATVIGINASYS
ncbi:IclR family transcriptional regulator [Natrialbaceae archaeon A-chndr2]